MKNLLIFATTILTLNTFAAEDLEKKLELLNVPDDKVTPVLEKEKLKVVNKRYSSLTNRHEVEWYGGNNFNADSHMVTRQQGLSYRYHLNQKWSFGYRYTQYYNELSAAGEQLFKDKNILPDKDYAVKSTDIFVNYNTTYGKLRISDSRVVYFDQYIALGYGDISLANSNTNFTMIDLGLAFWLGKNFSSRVGLKNELYEQEQQGGSQTKHNAMGYISFGYLFGGETI
jgi:outer membrane beta-barrel protein